MKRFSLQLTVMVLLVALTAAFFGCGDASDAKIVVYKSDVNEVNSCLKSLKIRENLPFFLVQKAARKNGYYQFRLDTKMFVGQSTDGHWVTLEVFDEKNNDTKYADDVFDILYSVDSINISTVKRGGITLDYTVYDTEISGGTVTYQYYLAVIAATERVFVSGTLITDGGFDAVSVFSDLFSL